MKKYIVYTVKVVYADYEVEAESREQAEEFFNESGGDIIQEEVFTEDIKDIEEHQEGGGKQDE
jgi:hypothetical protein